MGYDRERFVGEVDEDLLCSICRDVLEDPVLTPCEHAFCGGCIRRWLEEHRHCPEDRADLDATQLRALFRYMKKHLAQLKIRCRNRPQGCEFVGALDSIHRHEERCDPDLISCTNLGNGFLRYRYARAVSPPGSPEAHQHCRGVASALYDPLRAEMNDILEEMKIEMELSFEQQMRHALLRERRLMREMEELRCHISYLRCGFCGRKDDLGQ